MLTASPRNLLIAVLIFLPAVSFCQSLQETAPKTLNPDEYLHSLTGQKLLLLHFGDTTHAKVKRADLQKIKVSCDLAVQIQAVRHAGNKVSFDWLQIGTPTAIRNFPRNCSDNNYHAQGTLTITELAPDETSASLAESVNKILKTPEQYLAAEGIPFDFPPAPDAPKTASAITIPARPLLSVDAAFSEQASRAKYAGAVMIAFIVGIDGRIYEPKITRKLGMGLDEQALAVLPLWRFQPATKDGKPVPASLNIEMSFNLY